MNKEQLIQGISSKCPTPATDDILKTSADCLKDGKSPAVIHINLDAVANNIAIIRKLCAPDTEIMGVVKGGAYGSGLLPVVEELLASDVKHLAVATVSEGLFLRRAGITVPITVLGNLAENEMDDILQYNLMPSVSWSKAFKQFDKEKLKYPNGMDLKVNIKVDTGMSRYGVQLEDLPKLVNDLEQMEIQIHSIYTHFFSAIDESVNNQTQLTSYLKAIHQYRDRGIAFHVAATTGVVQRLATNLNFVRPGGALTGLCSGSDQACVEEFENLGFKPSLSVIAHATFYKQLPPERSIGYDGTYTTSDNEWIANLTTGWSDGYPRRLSGGIGVVKILRTGEYCPIVGRVSMDSITVKLPMAPNEDEIFQVISDDFDSRTSAVGIARLIGGAVYEIPGSWSTRLPRVYTKHGKVIKTLHSLQYET